MSCQFRDGLPTFLLQYYDTPSSSYCDRNNYPGSCFSTQYVPFREVHGRIEEVRAQTFSPRRMHCYGTEEIIEFCVDYLPDLNPIGLPVSHHEGRLKGKGTLGKKCNMNISCCEFSQA